MPKKVKSLGIYFIDVHDCSPAMLRPLQQCWSLGWGPLGSHRRILWRWQRERSRSDCTSALTSQGSRHVDTRRSPRCSNEKWISNDFNIFQYVYSGFHCIGLRERRKSLQIWLKMMVKTMVSDFPTENPVQVLVQAQPANCRGILMPWWAFLQWAAGRMWASSYGWQMDVHPPKDGKCNSQCSYNGYWPMPKRLSSSQGLDKTISREARASFQGDSVGGSCRGFILARLWHWMFALRCCQRDSGSQEWYNMI